MTRPAPEEIGIVMLAAGQSRRFEGDKRLALMPDGRTLLQASIDCVPTTLNRRLLVLHPGDDYLASSYRDQWEILIAPRATEGMGASLATAFNHLRETHQDWQGALIALGDMPSVAQQTYTRVQNNLCDHAIVLPHHQGQRGHPVGFQRSLFGELGQLSGDHGARQLLRIHSAECHTLNCEDAGILLDIDTREAMMKTDAGQRESPEL